VKNDEEKTAELILYGSIGSDEYWDDISDKVFKQDIENLGDVENITLHINSPGGSVFSAVAIANTLKNHKAKVTANIDGLAASAATIITSACDTVRMPKNALFMIHNPITFAFIFYFNFIQFINTYFIQINQRITFLLQNPTYCTFSTPNSAS